MNRLEKIFSASRKVVIASDVCGYPDMASSAERLNTLIAAGANILDLIIPFSDPMADGAEIQSAAQQALSNGANLLQILQMLGKIRQANPEVGMIINGYCNVFMQYGFEKLFSQLAELDFDGIIITDLPFEERSEIAAFSARYHIPRIVDCGLTDNEERLQVITAQAEGFVITANAGKIDFLRKNAPVPVASNIAGADAFITGVASVMLPQEKLADFIGSLR